MKSIPSTFSPTMALFPAVSTPLLHPNGEANGSPLKDCNVRGTTVGAVKTRKPGLGFGCGLSRSNTNPRGGDGF